MTHPIVAEQAIRLSPLIRRITQSNPGPMTGPGTNTYLVGVHSLLVIDPGQDTEEHFNSILAAIGDAGTYGIGVTHAHPDHWPLAPRLAAATGSQTIAFRASRAFQPDRYLTDGDVLAGPGWTIEAIHTPGHSGDHVCYLLQEENAVFTGDHVMGWSTSVILHPDGSLRNYMQSLGMLAARSPAVLYPGHGEPVTDPGGRIGELIAHRKERTSQILAAVSAGCSTVDSIVERVYPGIDPRLRSFARSSVEAHLADLDSWEEWLRARGSEPSLDVG